MDILGQVPPRNITQVLRPTIGAMSQFLVDQIPVQGMRRAAKWLPKDVEGVKGLLTSNFEPILANIQASPIKAEAPESYNGLLDDLLGKGPLSQ